VNLAWSAALAAVLTVVYVLSYAPVVRYLEDRPTKEYKLFDYTDGDELPFYRPVDSLIDSTPLRSPLIAWARIWGVGNTFQFAMEDRIGE
jgi:hypothetical protein